MYTTANSKGYTIGIAAEDLEIVLISHTNNHGNKYTSDGSYGTNQK